MTQRLVGHHRPEIGASDPDVDDRLDRLARMSRPLARADQAENADVRSSTACTCATTSVPSTIEDRFLGIRSATCNTDAVLRDVDPVAAEHRRDAVVQPAFVREREQQPDRFGRDPILRVVEAQAGPLRHKPVAPTRVGGERLPQMQILDVVVVPAQRPLAPAIA